jgi:hypothetical protein
MDTQKSVDYSDVHVAQLVGGDQITDQDCISKKTKILMDEGYPQDQAVAIAHKHCSETKKNAPEVGLGGGDLEAAHRQLQDETDGAAIYQLLSETTEDPALKALFLELSATELEHVKKLTAWIEAHRPKPSEGTVGDMSKSVIVPISKVQGDIVYGIVLKANVPDLQGDIMSPEDIKVAMHEFMEAYREINVDHANDVNACPVECWQAKEPGKLGNRNYGPGDWLMGTKVNDPETLQRIISGDLKSYSIEGVGQRVPLSEAS